MLVLEDLTKSFDGVRARQVLRNISLQVPAGEYIAIMGESGAGKSTLLNLIAGLDHPDAGRVVLDGEDLTLLGDAARTRLRRVKMGFVFQAFHLLPHLSVERNVALPLALNGIVGREAAVRIEEMLAAVGLSERRNDSPAKLSGGEMQRVAVARALIHKPSLVLADEPTGNLDADSATEVLELLRSQLKRDRATGILVTHSTIAAATADRIYRLSASGLRQE
ncbi:MAG TPA: ABC transporter ATP-binding protein [Povalibacter sp.]|nr:ABC transporter ATP-binding protein [Povalibacter sp.]